jgi:hypothetical protein
VNNEFTKLHKFLMFHVSHQWRDTCNKFSNEAMKDMKKNAVHTTTNTTNAQPPLALDVKRARKLVRTGVQGGGLNSGPCTWCSMWGWGGPPGPADSSS